MKKKGKENCLRGFFGDYRNANINSPKVIEEKDMAYSSLIKEQGSSCSAGRGDRSAEPSIQGGFIYSDY